MVEHNENNMLNLLSIIHVYYYNYVLLGLKNVTKGMFNNISFLLLKKTKGEIKYG